MPLCSYAIIARGMDVTELRIALFSGNYNCIRDGANGALNRLTEYLLRQGANVRVYSPTIEPPAFKPEGDLVSIASIPMPFRGEYRLPLTLLRSNFADIESFAPNLVHISSPDFAARQAVRWARKRGLPVVASVHTRFESYLRYYHLSAFQPLFEMWLRQFYQRCDILVSPTESSAQLLRDQRMNADVSIWSRGVDREIFNPKRRDSAWRSRIMGAKAGPIIAFLGRLVKEKGIAVFADTIKALQKTGIEHQVLVIGDGPERQWFEAQLPGAQFIGYQQGAALARALASADILFNPSDTEAMGNVMLEAMACSLPVVAAQAFGSSSVVRDGVTGLLARPGSIAGFAAHLARYCGDEALRAVHGKMGLVEAQKYNWDAVNQTVVDTYLRLMAQRYGDGRAPER